MENVRQTRAFCFPIIGRNIHGCYGRSTQAKNLRVKFLFFILFIFLLFFLFLPTVYVNGTRNQSNSCSLLLLLLVTTASVGRDDDGASHDWF